MRLLEIKTSNPLIFVLLIVVAVGCKSTGSGMGESDNGDVQAHFTCAFVTHYTGHVLANLAGPDGKRMHCEFQLLRASEGMKGGGEGRCQLPSGKTIKADFPPS
jgi:hypothetical protein